MREIRSLVLCVAGSFLLIAFMTLARSLREALYLTSFPVSTLPYLSASYVLLALPLVGTFSRMLTRWRPRKVLTLLLLAMAVGTLLLGPLLSRSRWVVVVFYFWTALGTLLLTSGFWIATAEQFEIRRAKRVFGYVGAGGTAGAMVMGTSLSWLTKQVPLLDLVYLLVAFPLLLVGTQFLLPAAVTPAPRKKEGPQSSVRESFSLVWTNRHLRTLGVVVITATAASTLVDFQFKELARATLQTKEELTRLFGSFYGWTGAISLALQLILTAPLIARGGLAVSLSLLPLCLIGGATTFLFLPSLWVAMLTRGADNSLRKSVHRSAVEVAYLPLPSELRKKTKTFVDSILDAAGEGLGSLLVFLWVTLAGLPSSFLSIGVLTFGVIFLLATRTLGARYFATVRERLKGSEGDSLFLATDLPHRREALHPSLAYINAPPVTATDRLSPESLADLRWSEERAPEIIGWLARDSGYREVARWLAAHPEASASLCSILREPDAEFTLRRRVPYILAAYRDGDSFSTLLDGLGERRFEVRYRCAVALSHRIRAHERSLGPQDMEKIWKAVDAELAIDRPVWEMQKLLDADLEGGDEFVLERIGRRGELSLEHMFRLLALVLDPDAVRSAYLGIRADGEERHRGLALEYLEQALPTEVRKKLWPFVGDMTAREQRKSARPVGEIVSDLLHTEATLFANDREKAALKNLLEKDPTR